jgi:hypothetical protein
MMSGVRGRRTNANFAGIDEEQGNQQRKDPDRTPFRDWSQLPHWVIQSRLKPSVDSQTRAFFTEKGMMGQVPPTAQTGDVIAILFGGEVPFVLRPVDGDKFTFIGECYVHGLMYGEALVEARKEADPTYDGVDKSWLERLHQEPIPFPTREFVLV